MALLADGVCALRQTAVARTSSPTARRWCAARRAQRAVTEELLEPVLHVVAPFPVGVCAAVRASSWDRRDSARAHALSAQPGRRFVVIGDPHGCLDECHALLARCGWRGSAAPPAPDPAMDVVFVGDLVAKGPKSREVVQFAMGIGV
jgi:hypothetical protein